MVHFILHDAALLTGLFENAFQLTCLRRRKTEIVNQPFYHALAAVGAVPGASLECKEEQTTRADEDAQHEGQHKIQVGTARDLRLVGHLFGRCHSPTQRYSIRLRGYTSLAENEVAIHR